MSSRSKYFVFVYPAAGAVRDYLNLAVFALTPDEKWPAHITVAGPFSRYPQARAQPSFDSAVFCLGAANFFRDGLNTVYLNVGMSDIRRYWYKPSFIGNPVPHLSIYNGDDHDYGRLIYSKIHALNLYFSFPVKGIQIVNSSKQGQLDLRAQVNTQCLDLTSSLSLDEIAKLDKIERLEIAVAALSMCKRQEPQRPEFRGHY